MSYELIGNGEQLLKHDGVNISADMSTYNNTGAALSNYKYIDYGSFNDGGDNGSVEYIVGQPETFSPYYGYMTYVGTGPSSNNLSSKYGFVSITYDDYRQHSRTSANATAKLTTTLHNVGTFAEWQQICLGDSIKLCDNSGNRFEIGNIDEIGKLIGNASYSVQFIAGNASNSSFKYNNNLWKIITPYCTKETTTGADFNMYDIWYDNNVLIHPVSGNWNNSIDKYHDCDSAGYFKADAFFYKDKRLIANKLVKNDVKILLDLSNNYLYYCDKPNNDYRVILSAKMPKDKALFSNCSSFLEVDNEWECDNPWGIGSKCYLFKKNLNVDYLNCPFEEALSYKPAPYTIHKDNITTWDNITLTYSNSSKFIVPGDPNVYTDKTFTPSSFSGEGYYVFKASISGDTSAKKYGLLTYMGGNMLKDNIHDEYRDAYVQPLMRVEIPSAGESFYNEGLVTYYVSAAPNSTAELPSGMRGGSDATMNNGFIRNYFPGSADRNFKIKYIFYKRKNSLPHNQTTQMLDYCLYDNYVSAYRPMGYLGIGDGVNDMILRNNSAFFEFASTANHSVYSTSASTTTFYNVEFFHTSSYYDALNG